MRDIAALRAASHSLRDTVAREVARLLAIHRRCIRHPLQSLTALLVSEEELRDDRDREVCAEAAGWDLHSSPPASPPSWGSDSVWPDTGSPITWATRHADLDYSDAELLAEYLHFEEESAAHAMMSEHSTWAADAAAGPASEDSEGAEALREVARRRALRGFSTPPHHTDRGA